ncbi:MAG TPA: hypothetical protein VG329_00260 [Candidatus Dormibacteraeota bacterium]|nr:hypothetical protein [Candidatus Dormibacteraeota bacterium]
MALPEGQEFHLGRVRDLDISMSALGIGGTLFNIVLFTLLGRVLFKRPAKRALAGGVTLALIHWSLELWHNLGHDVAARMTGHPMSGIRFGAYGVLGTGLYPDDEGELPPRVHITRALGGPIGSAAMSVGTGLLALVAAPFSFSWIPLVAFLDNLLVFTIGAWIPLGFNDVSTILYWMRRR